MDRQRGCSRFHLRRIAHAHVPLCAGCGACRYRVDSGASVFTDQGRVSRCSIELPATDSKPSATTKSSPGRTPYLTNAIHSRSSIHRRVQVRSWRSCDCGCIPRRGRLRCGGRDRSSSVLRNGAIPDSTTGDYFWRCQLDHQTVGTPAHSAGSPAYPLEAGGPSNRHRDRSNSSHAGVRAAINLRISADMRGCRLSSGRDPGDHALEFSRLLAPRSRRSSLQVSSC